MLITALFGVVSAFAGNVTGNTISDSLYNAEAKVMNAVSNPGTEELHRPFFREAGETVSINMLSLDASPVIVAVYSESGKLIFKENLKAGQSLGRIYDFSDAAKGTYTIEVAYKGNVFERKIRI